MNKLPKISGASRTPATRAIRRAGALAWLALPLLAGCTDWSYDRIQLGMTQRECERALPEDTLWRTELGFCYRQENGLGRIDALVILLTQDQRVAGKLQATTYPPYQRVGSECGYRLRGELDPAASILGATGPVDVARVLTSDLAGYRGAKPAMEAHAWVAAGLVRLLERWPHGETAAASYPTLAEALARIPGGGEAQIAVNPRGVYLFEYRQPAVP